MPALDSVADKHDDGSDRSCRATLSSLREGAAGMQGFRVYESRDGSGFSTLQGTFPDIAAMNQQLSKSAHPAVGVDIKSGIVVSVNDGASDDLIGTPHSRAVVTKEADDLAPFGDDPEHAAVPEPSGAFPPPPPPATSSGSSLPSPPGAPPITG